MKKTARDFQATLDALENVSIHEAFKIGKRDAKNNRASALRYVRDRIVSTTDDNKTDDWSDAMRRAYIEGYIEGGRQMGWW